MKCDARRTKGYLTYVDRVVTFNLIFGQLIENNEIAGLILLGLLYSGLSVNSYNKVQIKWQAGFNLTAYFETGLRTLRLDLQNKE